MTRTPAPRKRHREVLWILPEARETLCEAFPTPPWSAPDGPAHRPPQARLLAAPHLGLTWRNPLTREEETTTTRN
jgi:hypothetical protein